MLMDDLDWDEKDFDDLEVPDEEELRPRKLSYSKRILTRINAEEDTYPFDVWYLIGTYIPPEDLGRFALICRTTNRVVNTSSFWISIFNKYSKLETKRFSRILSKEHFSIIRTYVIRSLYDNYSLFRTRMNRTDAIQKEPHFLLTSRCIRIWYSKRPTQPDSYNYYFEFRFHDTPPEKAIQALSPLFASETRSLIDKDSYILHLISSNFVPIGPYMGMILSRLTLNVSSDYRYHKLKMWFDSSRLSTNTSNSIVTIDPILCLRIYRWYNIPANVH